jgi:LPXTG-site transpeptidase (sortase) family protein
MGSVFDENSEFLNYLKGKKSTQKITSHFEEKEEDHVELHIDDSNKESYVLNLKGAKLKDPKKDPKDHSRASTKRVEKKQEEPISKVKKTKRDKKIEKVHRISEAPTPTNGLGAFLIDKIKFLATSVAIFMIAFVAINWSAYSEIAVHWYRETTGVNEASPLHEFAQDQKVEQAVAAVETSPFAIEHFSVPEIDIEIVPPGTRIVIPRIGKNVPIVNVSDDRLTQRDWAGLEKDMQDALKKGVVHYPGTPWFDQSGNTVITGHSSYYPWDPGRFKDVFALLHQVEIGDEIIAFHKQKKYKYVIDEVKVVLPSQINVLGDSGDDRLTLITCTPIGTNLKRLIIVAKPVQ